MPIVYQHSINKHTKLGLWHITENEDFFAHIPIQQEITNANKRLQHLAGRQLLLALQPNIPLKDIQIAATRKPFIVNEPYHFSISHCGQYAAAIVSDKERVGVDVEVVSDKAFRVGRKFLSPSEISILPKGGLVESYTLAWSIKEAVFKWDSLGGIDFKKDMTLLSFLSEIDRGKATCKFKQKETLSVHFKKWDDHFLSWTL